MPSPLKCEIQIKPRHNYSAGDVMFLTRFSKLFWAELIKAVPPLIKLFVFAKRSPPAHCCLLMSSCVTAPCLLIEGEMKAEIWKKNDPLVADFLTGSTEAIAQVTKSRQLRLVNRQLCGCSEGSCDGYRQHRFSFYWEALKFKEKLCCAVTVVSFIVE